METERLILREFTADEGDLQALLSILSDKEVNRFLPWYPLVSVEEVRRFYEGRIAPRYEKKAGFFFAVCLKEEHRPIGYISVSGEENHDFGYGLKQEYWNQGIITEAGQAVVDFLKASGWHYITATHDIHNRGSGKVMEKLGMTYKYSYKEQWQPKNILVTFRMYQLNFDGDNARVYKEYWEKYPEHFIEVF